VTRPPPFLDPQITLGQALRCVAQHLAQHQVCEVNASIREAQMLIEAALTIDTLTFHARRNDPLTAFAQQARLKKWLHARLTGQPLSRLKGTKDFWQHTFCVTPDVLDPRPETETLLAVIEKHVADHEPPQTILELGVGSGCVLLSLLKLYPAARGWGTDLSPSALEVAQRNAHNLQLSARTTWAHGPWFEALDTLKDAPPKFDLIVSNPPYIPTQAIALLDKAVQDFDPHVALDGGPDGLDAYRAFLPQAPHWLSKDVGSALVLEIGHDQGEAVQKLAHASFASVLCHQDLSGNDRVILATQPGETHA